MKFGWGPIEAMFLKAGGWTAVFALLITYLPQLTGLYDFGQYAPVVTVVIGGIVSVLKLYVTDNTPKVTSAVQAEKVAMYERANR